MGDKQKKPAEKKKKKLDLNKETVKELSEEDLDQVAGGVTGGCGTGDLAAPKGTRHCATVSCNCY